MLHELLAQVFVHLRGMWRFRWLAMALAWVIAVPGWAIVATVPDVYESTARVHIDTESMLEPLLQGLAIQTDMRTRVAMMTRALLTRPKLEKVARQADLDLQINSPDEMNQLVEQLTQDTRIGSSLQDQNMYSISHFNADAETSQRVVQAFLDIFVEETLGANRMDNSTAQKFLVDQIAAYEERLVRAEQALVEFKKANIGIMPGEGGDFYRRLQSSMSELNRMRTALNIAKGRRDGLKRQLRGEEPVFGLMPQRALQQQVENKHTIELDARIEAYRTRKGELSIQYTDKHPEIQAIKEAIELLEKRRDKELAKLQQKQEQLQREDGSTGGAGVELQQNPVYQSMKIAFNAAEIEVAALTAEMNAISDGVAELQRMVNIIPQVEANLGRLNRDYAIVKEKYNGLLQRLETAKLSRRAEQSGENIEFQVIDPPTLPDRPSKPNRMLLNSLVVAASFVAGGALTFALHLLFPVFGDARTLGNSVGFPVLGVVSLKRGRAQKIQSVVGCIAVASAALLLLVVAAGIITYEEKARSAFQSLIRLI